jgi:hypothetical protein
METMDDALAMLRRLQISVAKSRSVAIESQGKDVAYLVSPSLAPDSLLNGALERALDTPGVVADWLTVRNILTLAHRDPIVPLGYALRFHDDLPRPENITPTLGAL